MRRFALALCITAAAVSAQKTVALDGFHNNESKMPDHYMWDGTKNGGFSELGKVITGMGADLRTVRSA